MQHLWEIILKPNNHPHPLTINSFLHMPAMSSSSNNMTSVPPFLERYKSIFLDTAEVTSSPVADTIIEQCDLPMIDLRGLSGNQGERRACMEAIGNASSEWGFFQVLNHGISSELLGEMRVEQRKLFDMSFEEKANDGLLNSSYRWGTPTATTRSQFSWSEAFHVPLAKISSDGCYGEFNALRDVMEKLAGPMSELARTLASILAENLGHDGGRFPENCDNSTCFLRLNRYPPCPFSPETFGLMPHTDSDFLTILYQDQVGGLQLMKNSKWVAVKPNPSALIVNIGDLFQAWSNNIYKSVMHKVVANAKAERYSIAYFLCPSYESTIGSCKEETLYKSFTFGEFRKQVQEDVKTCGYKVGLPRFLL